MTEVRGQIPLSPTPLPQAGEGNQVPKAKDFLTSDI